MKGPNDTKWGEVIRVHVAPNGNIWVFHRCFNRHRLAFDRLPG
jgi:hypothetical protein